MNRKAAWVPWFFLLLPACATLPESPPAPAPAQSGSVSSSYQPDQFQSYDSLHFTVKGQDYARISQVADWSEEVYRRIMFDTNLLSFKPRENYPITVYADQDQYRRVTGYPAWSGGGTVTELMGEIIPAERENKALTSIATFESIATPPLLAHEITHLIFNEFMEFRTAEDSRRLLWLNEGLATYEEFQAHDPVRRDEFLGVVRSVLKSQAMPLDQMTEFRPVNEPQTPLGTYFLAGRVYSFTNIDLWYWQVRSLTDFLISKQGQYKFFLFLNALKQGQDLVPALEIAYPGRWRNLYDLEGEWKQSLQ